MSILLLCDQLNNHADWRISTNTHVCAVHIHISQVKGSVINLAYHFEKLKFWKEFNRNKPPDIEGFSMLVGGCTIWNPFSALEEYWYLYNTTKHDSILWVQCYYGIDRSSTQICVITSTHHPETHALHWGRRWHTSRSIYTCCPALPPAVWPWTHQSAADVCR